MTWRGISARPYLRLSHDPAEGPRQRMLESFGMRHSTQVTTVGEFSHAVPTGGVHSSNCQLNLSRLCHRNHSTDPEGAHDKSASGGVSLPRPPGARAPRQGPRWEQLRRRRRRARCAAGAAAPEERLLHAARGGAKEDNSTGAVRAKAAECAKAVGEGGGAPPRWR